MPCINTINVDDAGIDAGVNAGVNVGIDARGVDTININTLNITILLIILSSYQNLLLSYHYFINY